MLPDRRAFARFFAVFVGVFGILVMPWTALGGAYSGAFSALGNAFVEDASFDSGVLLRFQSAAEAAQTEQGNSEPSVWESTLVVHSTRTHKDIRMPIDLRTLVYLPTAAFIALALAAPGAWWRRLTILVVGLGILEPLTLLLIALPMISFLGGAGPIAVFRIAHFLHWPINIAYRALVTPPGMTYAIPGFIWWALLSITSRPSGEGEPRSTERLAASWLGTAWLKVGAVTRRTSSSGS